MRVVLTRHGATAGNLRKCYVGGATDEPLCPEGLAALIVRDTAVNRVYTSGLLRTRQTAAVLYPNARQVALPALREMEFGIFEGKNWQELEACAAYTAWVESGCTAACPGGEGSKGFVRRCREAFLHALQREATSPEVCFVVHGGTIMAVLSELAQPPREYFSIQTPPGGGWVCEWNGESLIVLEAP